MNASALLLISLLVPAAAGATTVWRSVGEDGTVRFSDRPPEDADAVAIEIEVGRPEPSPEVEARREAMRELADELREERLARERERAADPPAAPPPDYASGYRPDPEWLPVYVSPWRWHPPLRHPHWKPAPRPLPDPQSRSPRGLLERIREAQ